MSTLVLDSLEIKNFRAFKHLRIEKLGRVNLIVGKNNVGKSSVLEALWIYAEQGEPALLYRLLTQRDELTYNGKEPARISANTQERSLAFNNLFFDRADTKLLHSPICISSVAYPEDSVQVDVEWNNPQWTMQNGELSEATSPVYAVPSQPPTLVLRLGQGNPIRFPLVENYVQNERVIPIGYADYVTTFVVGAAGLSPGDLVTLWDMVALSDLEPEVIAALKIITPQLVAVNFVSSDRMNSLRTPKARMSDANSPVSLRSLGEGMNRMLGIALALVNAKDGMLLIDEVDTGLHYSVLPDMWKLIFEVAHRLNVQVFATSHSWDCIQAFQQAAADSKEAEGVLIRLEQRKDGIGAVTFDEGELAIVTREQIEVR